jgi:hypothetical protein
MKFISSLNEAMNELQRSGFGISKMLEATQFFQEAGISFENT